MDETEKITVDHTDQSALCATLLDVLQAGSEYPIIFELGKLRRWSGTHWEAIDDGYLNRFVFGLNKVLVSSAGKTIPINYSQVAGIVAGMRELASEWTRHFENLGRMTQPGLVAGNRYLSVTEDGLVDTDPRPEQMAMFSIPKASPGPIPNFLRFLREVFEGDSDADEKVQVIQEFIGACLTGKATDYQRALLIVGRGGNGKSVLCDILCELFPDSTQAAVGADKFGNGAFLDMLAGKFINIVPELSTREVKDGSGIKSIVSGDVVTANQKYERPYKFRTTAGHIFSTNSLPRTSDHSEGFLRRFIILEFNNDMRDRGKTTRDILDEIRPELGAIAYWAMEGAARLMKRKGYFLPATHRLQATDWAQVNDQVLAFLESEVSERYVPGSRSKDGQIRYGVAPALIYDAYTRWADKANVKPLNMTNFFKRLKETLDRNQHRRTKHGMEYGLELNMKGVRNVRLVKGV